MRELGWAVLFSRVHPIVGSVSAAATLISDFGCPLTSGSLVRYICGEGLDNGIHVGSKNIYSCQCLQNLCSNLFQGSFRTQF